MNPPKDVTVIETETSRYWYDSQGVLYAVIKNAPALPMEMRVKAFREFSENLNDKKVCMVLDISDAGPISRETQKFNSKEFPKVFNAIAFVSRSAFGRMLGHLYLGMRESPFPTRIFADEVEAAKWIRHYL